MGLLRGRDHHYVVPVGSSAVNGCFSAIGRQLWREGLGLLRLIVARLLLLTLHLQELSVRARLRSSASFLPLLSGVVRSGISTSLVHTGCRVKPALRLLKRLSAAQRLTHLNVLFGQFLVDARHAPQQIIAIAVLQENWLKI